MASAFKVLAVDGGGIRGLIPAFILAAIEEQTGHPIHESFDLIAGTSTGGIIALGLTKPNASGGADKSARDLIRLYEDEGRKIFPTSFLQGLHLGAIRGSKYTASGVEGALTHHFGDARLKDALIPVMVPAYDIEKQTTIFFKSKKARAQPDADFLMRDIARATSAAPTYFTPVKLPTSDRLNYYALVDGGVVAANPAMCAYAEAVRMCAEAGTPPEQIFMVSLGTGEQRRTFGFEKACEWGQLEWAQPIIDIVLQGSNATVDYQLQYLLEPGGDHPTYFRFQLPLSSDTGDMDDASDANQKRLIDLVQNYLTLSETRDKLKRLCELLTA
jgi:patatin-like phospholipase/acyl hydrolase